jgi:hypothetical protein
VVSSAIAAGLVLEGPDLSRHAATFLGLVTWTLRACALAGGLATLLHLPFRLRGSDGAGETSFAASLLLSAAILDRLHQSVFGTHVDRPRFDVIIDALRSGTLHVPWPSYALSFAVFVALLVALFVAQKLVSLVPRPAGLTGDASLGAQCVVLAAGLLVALRESSVDRAPLEVSALNPFARESTSARLTAIAADLEHAPVAAKFRPDILVLHVESLRFDMMTPEIMPALTRFAESALTVPHYYSSGDDTAAGMFGLLTGLYAPLFPFTREAKLAPLPLRVLHRLGYGVSIAYTYDLGHYAGLYDALIRGSADFTYPKRFTGYVDVGDAEMIDLYFQRLAKPREGPRFDYLIFDSTHYPYIHPPELAKFLPEQPLTDGPTAFVPRKADAEIIRNRYRNAAAYVDTLLARVLDRLTELGALKSTIVVITGDHGEEFWEHGGFSHGVALDQMQTRVPLALYLPPELSPPARLGYTYASHSDILPTIFDAMQVTTGTAPFMSGKSLLRFEPAADVALLGFDDEALRNRHVTVVGDDRRIEMDDIGPIRVREIATESDEPVPLVEGAAAMQLARRGLSLETLRTPTR